MISTPVINVTLYQVDGIKHGPDKIRANFMLGPEEQMRNIHIDDGLTSSRDRRHLADRGFVAMVLGGVQFAIVVEEMISNAILSRFVGLNDARPPTFLTATL